MDIDELNEEYDCKFLPADWTILYNFFIVSYARNAFKIQEMKNISKVWDRIENFEGKMTREELNIINNALVTLYQRHAYKMAELRNIGRLWSKIQKILNIPDKADIISLEKIPARLDLKTTNGYVMRPLQNPEGKHCDELTNQFGKLKTSVGNPEKPPVNSATKVVSTK